MRFIALCADVSSRADRLGFSQVGVWKEMVIFLAPPKFRKTLFLKDYFFMIFSFFHLLVFSSLSAYFPSGFWASYCMIYALIILLKIICVWSIERHRKKQREKEKDHLQQPGWARIEAGVFYSVWIPQFGGKYLNQHVPGYMYIRSWNWKQNQNSNADTLRRDVGTPSMSTTEPQPCHRRSIYAIIVSYSTGWAIHALGIEAHCLSLRDKEVEMCRGKGRDRGETVGLFFLRLWFLPKRVRC